MSVRSPYSGPSRKLVLAFDVGTTYSGISYSILDPGQVPEIKGVTRFPAQDRVGGDSKIPTIIYYDQDGAVRAVGAEATKEGLQDMVEDEGWTKAEWFKLHLRPKTTASSSVTQKLPPLPKKKSVVDLFADFMRYLCECAKTYIEHTHANGASLWASVEPRIEFILTHPNGWEGAQQDQMRKAAILAGLIPNTDDGHSRIHFVTEGEASLHFCIQSGLTTDAMQDGDGVLIVDAGGGTIDLSAYGCGSGLKGYSFEEIATPQCHFQGSIFVTRYAREFLEDFLRDTRFSDDIINMTNSFDKSTKLTFRNINEPQYIKFGSARDKDLKLNIRSGQLKLLGTQVAAFFEPSISCIIRAIVEQRETAKKNISSIFLVGGFAASDWLFSRLKGSLEPLGISFCRPDSHVNKAVADGAISFYLDHYVAVRVSKLAYGVPCHIPFDPTLSEHQRRSHDVYTSVTGDQWLRGAFSVILSKDIQVSETQEFRKPYLREAQNQSELNFVSTILKCYRGFGYPVWTDIDPDMYSTLCTIEADTSQLSRTLKPRPTGKRNRKSYYRMDYDIILSFGLTELKAQVCWIENGEEKRSPAKIVYDPDVAIRND